MEERTANEQAVDLRLLLVALRRRRRAVAGAVLIGALLGVALALLFPAPYTSSSLMLLGSSTTAPQTAGATSGVDIATQSQIVLSDPVLSQAGKDAGFPMSVRELRKHVSVDTPTGSLLEVKASAAAGVDAQHLATAVANAYVDYTKNATAPLSAQAITQLRDQATTLRAQADTVDQQIAATKARQAAETPTSAGGQKDAQLLALLTTQQSNLAVQISQLNQQINSGLQTSATAAGPSVRVVQAGTDPTRQGPARRLALFGFAGALLGLVVGSVYAVVRTRRDPRLRSPDDVARSLGAPVLAGLVSHPQRSATDWSEMLAGYEPAALDAWTVRLVLRELAAEQRRTRGQEPREPQPAERLRVTIISLVSDPRALALGPQFAAIAASLGVSTGLVGLPPEQSGSNLWTGLTLARQSGTGRKGLEILRALKPADNRELIVVLAVADPASPALNHLPPTQATLLAVSPGAATAEDLARVALAADSRGRRINGVLLADPDDWDHPIGVGAVGQHVAPGAPTLVPVPGSSSGPSDRAAAAQRRRR